MIEGKIVRKTDGPWSGLDGPYYRVWIEDKDLNKTLATDRGKRE